VRSVPVELNESSFILGVPNEFARDWVEKRFAGLICESLESVLGAPVDVRVAVDERAASMTVPAADEPDPAADETPPGPDHGRTSNGQRPVAQVPADLNPRYVFDRWVVGPHNEYATAVAHSVAEAPAKAYNPVFVYADTGLGKTHLIQAIAHAAHQTSPGLQFKYVTVERFTDDFINALTDKGRIEGFKQAYRDNDILLVDDVQFLAEKQQTQVEFFHTFNSLYEAGKQIVITSDRPPRELQALEERLRSRFGQGVVVDIGRPDLETRIAILRKQVKWERFKLGDPEVLEYIASHITTNIRELYGALTRVVSYASISDAPVTLDVAKEALKDLLPKSYAAPITMDAIQAEVARQFGTHVADLRGDRRGQTVAYARQIAMYLSRNLTDASLPQIGDRFGGRHHTTVLYGVNKIDKLLKDGHDRQLHDLIQTITARLKSQS
jgi:chromosomal replication initiator protein